MSLPTFPANPPLTIKDSLNMILTSVAMEELALSHIINAEGEKLQYVLGTLEGSPNRKVSIEETLAVNKSIKCMLDTISQNQLILKSKMECAVEALKDCGCCKPEPAKPCAPCHAVSFPGCPNQCWYSGEPLKWMHSKCSKSDSLYLADDCKRIRLAKNKCYSVNFSVNLCTADCRNLSISLRTYGCKILDRFVYQAPIHAAGPFTASASGIFVETCNCNCPTDLILTVLSPAAVKVNQSSIYITELE